MRYINFNKTLPSHYQLFSIKFFLPCAMELTNHVKFLAEQHIMNSPDSKMSQKEKIKNFSKLNLFFVNININTADVPIDKIKFIQSNFIRFIF